MKTYNRFLIVFAVLILFFLFPKLSFSQNTNNLFKRYWSVNLNTGANLFWGDLRQNDYFPVSENENEWQIGYGLIVNWQISPVFGVRGQLLNGKLSGTKRKINRYFTADIFESNINVTANFSNLFFQYKQERLFSVYGMIGVGLANWCTKKKVLGTNEVVAENGCGNGNGLWGRAMEVVIPVGLGLDFRLNDNWVLNLESTLHSVNSDELDMKVGESKYDMYSYASLGVTYKFIKGRKKAVYTEESIQEEQDEEILPDVEPQVSIISEMPEMIYSEDEFIVKLIVNKENIVQSGKIIQYFPDGFLPTTTSLTNGSFIFEDRTLTINWEMLSDISVFTTSYKVLTDSLSTYNYLIIGKFIYSYQDQEKSIDFENIVKVEQKSEIVFEDDIVLEDQDTKVIDDQIKYPVEEKVVEIIPISEIEYRVQIRAKYGEKLSETWIANKYNLNQEIKENYYNGFYIYTIGSFPTFETAQKYSDELRLVNNVNGAFVVAFRNGKRLDTKELFIKEKETAVVSVSGIEYRVQIRAKFGKKVSKTWLANQYNLNQEIKEDLNNEYYIYTLGSFTTYEAARKYRDELRLINKISGAFVVAFRNGKRFNSLEDINR